LKESIAYRAFNFGIRIYIELPFFSIKTSTMSKSWERCVYEVLCFEIKLFKWVFSFEITKKPKNYGGQS